MLNLLRKIIVSPKTALIFSVGLAATSIIGDKINDLFVYVFIAIFIAYVVMYITMSIADYLRIRVWLKMNNQAIINEKVEHDWRVDAKGNFNGKYIYNVKNTGSSSVSVLPFDDLLWFSKPNRLKLDCAIISSSGRRRIVSYRHTIVRYIFDVLGDLEADSIAWSHVVDPSLGHGETMRYQLNISTSATEKAAFSESGTFAGIPATIPTQQAKLHYIAPKDYYFVLIKPVLVVDNRGNRYQDEENEITPPILSGARTVLTWELRDLLFGRRYWFKYRFVKGEYYETT